MWSSEIALGNSRMRELVFWCLLHLANLVSGAVLCSPCKIPRHCRKRGVRERICALYGRSMRAGAGHFYTPFGQDQGTLALDIFFCVDVGGERVE